MPVGEGSIRSLVPLAVRAARASRVERIAFGTLDYALDLDLAADDRGLLYSGVPHRARVARGWDRIANRRRHTRYQR
jgi:hypothetical protein